MFESVYFSLNNPVEWIPGATFPCGYRREKKAGRFVKLTAHLNEVLRLRICRIGQRIHDVVIN
jgi:hypothetical protein